MKKVLIIGGGFAGSIITKKLENKFDVTLIDSKDYFEIIDMARNLRDDLQVYFICHSEEIHKDFEVVRKMKTLGNMLDSKITLEGLFNVVLYAALSLENQFPSGLSVG